jgi:hypothetical protein
MHVVSRVILGVMLTHLVLVAGVGDLSLRLIAWIVSLIAWGLILRCQK